MANEPFITPTPRLLEMPGARADVARRAVARGAGWDWSPVLLERQARAGCARLLESGEFYLLETWSLSGGGQRVRSLWGRGTAVDLAAIDAAVPGPIQRVDVATRDYVMGLGALWNIRWIEDGRFANFVYNTAEQVSLEGARFGRRRTYLSSLARRGGQISRGPVDLTAAGNCDRVLQIDREWVATKEPSPTIDDETESLRLSLTAGGSSILGCGVRDNGLLISFGIFEMVGGCAIVHHVKGPSDSAVFAATWHAVFEMAADHGADLVNGGYDGGLKGLRGAKAGLRPSAIRANYIAVMDIGHAGHGSP